MNKIKEDIQNEVLLILSSCIDESKLRSLRFLQIVYRHVTTGDFILRRSIYYEDVCIFKNQGRVNSLISRYTKRFQCMQEDLRIKSGSKGIFHGFLIFYYKDFVSHAAGRNLIPDMDEIEKIECENQNVFVIEKESVLDKVVSKTHITVCGKGYPCRNTIKLLKLLEDKCRIFCITDFDPYGLHIFTNYQKYIKSIRRIGIGYDDLFKYKVSEVSCVGLSAHDLKMIQRLKETDVRDQAAFIEGLGYKLEMEAIFNQVGFCIDYFILDKCMNEF